MSDGCSGSLATARSAVTPGRSMRVRATTSTASAGSAYTRSSITSETQVCRGANWVFRESEPSVLAAKWATPARGAVTQVVLTSVGHAGPMEYDIDKAVQLVSHKVKGDGTCPVCSAKSWDFEPLMGLPTADGGGSLRLLPMVCVECGYTRFFSAVTLGLIEPE